MFTIKFYTTGGPSGYRQRILQADSFTVLRDAEGAEITLHRHDSGDDIRVDVRPYGPHAEGETPYARAIIENANGRTTEIIDAGPRP